MSVELTKAQAKFIHVRHGYRRAGLREFTVAYHQDEVSGQFFAAFAYCSLKDHYDRKLGSSLALERLNAGMAGDLSDHQLYLPISDVTFFTEPKALRAFAVQWGQTHC